MDSFVRKFHQLWNDGYTAHLDLDTQAGNAWVGLRVNLGHVPGPIHGHVTPTPHHRHVPPSRLRRRARREAARKNNAEEAANEDIGNKDSVVIEGAEQVPNYVAIDEKHIPKEMSDIDIDVAKKVTANVSDEFCHDKEFDAAKADSETREEEIEVEFISNYGEEDIVDSFQELFADELLPGIPDIVSRERVAPRSADHLCKIRMKMASKDKKNFEWPVLRGYPDFFKNVKML